MINVWSRSRRPEAGEKAEGYLRKILKIADGKQNTYRHNSRSFKEEQPRVFEFTSTIRAWYNSNIQIAPYKADEILHLLLEQVKKGNERAIPDSTLFGVILRALAASAIPNKHIYADRILELMIEFEIQPNTMLLDALLRCYPDLHEKSVPPSYSIDENSNDSS